MTYSFFATTMAMYLLNVLMTFNIFMRLRAGGTSPDLKKYYLRRHLIYFSIFTVIVMDTTFDQLSIELPWESKSDIGSKIINISVSAIRNLTGVALAWFRLSEPFIWATL